MKASSSDPSAVDRALPRELKVPNAQTQRAMAESEELMRRGRARFTSADEMFAKLEGVRGPREDNRHLHRP